MVVIDSRFRHTIVAMRRIAPQGSLELFSQQYISGYNVVTRNILQNNPSKNLQVPQMLYSETALLKLQKNYD
jgi:hypothetical protein